MDGAVEADVTGGGEGGRREAGEREFSFSET